MWSCVGRRGTRHPATHIRKLERSVGSPRNPPQGGRAAPGAWADSQELHPRVPQNVCLRPCRRAHPSGPKPRCTCRTAQVVEKPELGSSPLLKCNSCCCGPGAPGCCQHRWACSPWQGPALPHIRPPSLVLGDRWGQQPLDCRTSSLNSAPRLAGLQTPQDHLKDGLSAGKGTRSPGIREPGAQGKPLIQQLGPAQGPSQVSSGNN